MFSIKNVSIALSVSKEVKEMKNAVRFAGKKIMIRKHMLKG
jgi:hypothetical protein